MYRVPLLLSLWACASPSPHGADHPAVPHVAPEGPGTDASPRVVPLSGEAPVAYEVSLLRAHTQLVDVVASARASGPTQTWMMPTWTPGSYLVREYARHVQWLTAYGPDLAPLPVRKVAKNRWEVATDGVDQVTLSYTLYANEPSVRSNWVHADAAVLNGASTFLTPLEHMQTPYDLRLLLPEGWARSESGLGAHADGEAHHYVATSFDELVDSPVVAGNPVVHDFEVAGIPHRLVDLGGRDVWDSERGAKDVQAITEVVTEFWGTVPYERYVYLNVIGDDLGGGLEHLDSTLMMARRGAADSDSAWQAWLGLVSHEFFHTWNVKRLRPVGLGPFDYESEVYTPNLWVAEGLTSYYDDLLLVRAGLIGEDEHLARLSRSIGALQHRPGRANQALSEASFDAWIKHYRPDENSVNTQVSYYRKGSLVGWLLDARIQQATGGRASLDDVMRTLYARFLEDGYTAQDVRAVASEVAGQDLSDLFDAYVDGTDELDYTQALAWFGLRFPPRTEPDGDEAPDGWLGLELGGGRVREVRYDTPAFAAGLNVGDELLAIDGVRWEGGGEAYGARFHPGDTATLTIARDGYVRDLPVTFAEAPEARWGLQRDRLAGTAAVLRRDRWWGKR